MVPTSTNADGGDPEPGAASQRAVRIAMRRMLFLAQVPPPLHGASAMSKRALDLMRARGDMEIEQIWLGGAVTTGDVGRRSLGKMLGFLKFLGILAWKFVAGTRYDFAYLTLAPFSHAALRDGLLIAMSKLVAERTLVHLHAERLEVVLAGETPTMRLLRRMIRGAELIAITQGVVEEVRPTGHFSAVHLLANCVDDPGPQPIDSRDEFTCGFLANLDPNKGVLRFLDGIEVLVGDGLRVKGRIAGPSTAMLSIEALRAEVDRRGLNGEVEVLGPVYGEEKIAFLRSLDVFLYLSQRDYFPLVAIEAMACGVVPIVFDFAGQRELVSPDFEANVVAPDRPGDAVIEDVRRICRRYAGDREFLLQERQKARAFFLASYTDERFRRRFNAILDCNEARLAESQS